MVAYMNIQQQGATNKCQQTVDPLQETIENAITNILHQKQSKPIRKSLQNAAECSSIIIKFLRKAEETFSKMSQQTNSVLIIGAGLSGLTAAEEILKGDPKANVTILEAMAAPGGRTRSVKVNGTTYDMGAEWVGHPHKYSQQLARRANLEMIDQPVEGNKIIEFGDELYYYKNNLPQNLGYAQYTYLQNSIARIEALAETVPLDDPRSCPNAIEYDSMTAHTWIEKNIWFEKVRRFLELQIRANLGCEVNEVSFLFFLWYVRHNGFENMMNTQDGLQAHKFVRGTQSMSFFLEKEIKKRGAKIHYNSFVGKVIQNKDGVTVFTRKGEKYQASYLIMAAPPMAIKRIHFEPQLSRERRFIADRYVMGAFSKLVILYDKQYWMEKGFTGELLSDCHNGPVLNAMDQSRLNQNGELQPALLVICGAGIEHEWSRNKEQFERQTVEQLANYFQCPEMLKPQKVIMKIWNEEESLGGAPTAYTPPGVLSKISNMRAPEGRIHWAGTETALISQGYMNGAIESGIRVSKQILGRFKEETPVTWRKEAIQPEAKWYAHISASKRGFFSRL